jgi:peptide/nickel transport system substrate-binding protein
MACAPSSSFKAPSEAAKANILTINIGANPSFLNPILSTDSTSHAVTRMIFNGLFKKNVDLDMVPDLVASYTVSDDGMTYIFTLKPNVTWHDGHPFTADDVVFTFNTLLDPKTNTVRRGHFLINSRPIQFEAIGKLTVRATLPQPYAPFLSVLDMGILPKHRLNNEPINTTNFNRHPIGTGPFKFVEWRPEQFIRLTRNDQYFKPNAKLNGIIMRIIPDVSTSLIALRNGEIDVSGVPPKDIKRIKKIPSLAFFTYNRLNYSYIGLNLQRPPFNDPHIRHAIQHAINKQSIIDGVLLGYGEPAHIPSNPLSWAYPKKEDITPIDYNPAKAKERLIAAGYTYNTDHGVYQKKGEPLTFNLMVAQGSRESERIAQIVQRFLANVGVTMTIQIMEWSSLLKTLHANTDPKPYDAVLLGWGFDINDPDDAYTSWHSSQYPSGGNLSGFLNPDADALLAAGRREQRQEKRRDIYTSFYQTIVQTAPYVFLFYPQSTAAAHRYVKGLSKPGPAGILHDIESVYIDL